MHFQVLRYMYHITIVRDFLINIDHSNVISTTNSRISTNYAKWSIIDQWSIIPTHWPPWIGNYLGSTWHFGPKYGTLLVCLGRYHVKLQGQLKTQKLSRQVLFKAQILEIIETPSTESSRGLIRKIRPKKRSFISGRYSKHCHRQNVTSHHSSSLHWQFQLLELSSLNKFPPDPVWLMIILK